jgi:hypothetical protein
MATPVWQGGQAGLLGTAAAIAPSAQVNQLLGAHANQLLYQGNSILLPNGSGGPAWGTQLSTLDFDQPFTMSGTNIGRVAIPVLAVGNGADLLVSLCSDNGSGQPGTMIVQTRIPVSWITSFASVAGVQSPASVVPPVELTNNPLALAQFNRFHMNAFHTTNWPYPTSGGGGPSTSPCSTCFSNYFIQMGGSSGSTYFNNVFTIEFDTAGHLEQAIPQPPLPVATDGSAAAVVATDTQGNNTVVFMGGSTATGVITTNVFTASISSTGTLSAWTTQTSLPVTNQFFGAAAYGQYVYMVGGSNPGLSSVYYNTVSNGQLGSWVQTTSLPFAQGFSYCVAVNGFLYVFGGFISSTLNTSYYAPINANGSLGAWITGPTTLPVSTDLGNGNAVPSLGNYGVLGNGGGSLLLLSSTSAGPDNAWYGTNFNSGGLYYAVDQVSDGEWIYYGIFYTTYSYMNVTLAPTISVPLPATGLTNGSTYHILMQQVGGDASDYLRLNIDHSTFPGNPIGLTSARGAYTWSNSSGNTEVPLQIFDQTVTGQAWHTWEDSGVRISTFAFATTPDQRLLGLAEATRLNLQRNANSGFQSGISPWTPTGGTAVQSSTQYFEGGSSAQITPSGSAANVYIESELMACLPGQSITVSGWMWFTSAVTTNASMSINWYTLSKVYASTSSHLVSVAATAWTNLANTFSVPSGAYFYTIVPTLSGTPAASNIFYVDQAYSTDPVTAQVSSVVEVTYNGDYANGETYPPTGVVELA